MIDADFVRLITGVFALTGIAAIVILLVVGWIENRDDEPPQPPQGGDIILSHEQLVKMLRKEYMRGRAAGWVERNKQLRQVA
jgi:hypothetical protein